MNCEGYNMKINYQEYLDAYHENRNMIINSYLTYAMEAETIEQVSGDEEEQKKKTSERLINGVKHLVDEIYAIIDRLIHKLNARIQRFLLSDKGFEEQYREARKNNSPLEAIKLITYDYDTTYIDHLNTNFTKTCFSLLSSIDTSYSALANTEKENPLDMSESDLTKYILQRSSVSESISDMNLLFEDMKNSFRRNKKEKLFTASRVESYYTIAVKQKDTIKNTVSEKERLLKGEARKLKDNLNMTIRNRQLPDEMRTRATKQAKNTMNVYNIYSTFLSIYIEMKMEEMLTYRTVLKKLYHF